MTLNVGAVPLAYSEIESLNDVTTRASMRVRTIQFLRTLPVVLVALIALEFAFHGRVSNTPFQIWVALLAGSCIGRAVLCRSIKPHVETAALSQLAVYEVYLYVSAALNGIAIGLSFWLVALSGDMTVKLVITLISCFFAIGALVNASSHFSSYAVVTVINLGQGVLFWLGVGPNNAMHLEVAFPYAAVAVIIISFGYENSKQFAESLRIRTENVALLKQLGREKQLVDAALEEARKASESKSRFLAAASHDLRQPLHALTMFLGTLTFHVTTEDAKRLLNRIKQTTMVLEDQFNSLLDLSRFDVGAVETEISSFQLDRLVEILVDEFRHEAELKHLSISAVVCRAAGLSDRNLIERVLRNLIANAVKYTTSGSVIVRVEQRDSMLIVEVVDTGPGIPIDQQVRIFDEYVQLTNPARQRRLGVGLGLAIVKRIDSLLGLKLTLQSSVGFGSAFSFSIPLVNSTESIIHPEREVIDTTAFKTTANIWVLDDDPSVLEGLRGQLLAWGATVETFSHPAVLLEKLRTHSELPRWILTDDMLGSALSGLETAQILSSEYGFGRVCLITGNTEPKRLAQLRSSGFPVIIKPAQPELLISVIRD